MENLLKKYFTAHVNKHPQSPCIEWEGKVYDYAAVNSIAVKIQAVIEGLNISNKCIIVPNDRSLYNYAAVLAIQFSGNAFMPVDGDWPPARIAEVIKLVQPAAVVVQLPVANSLAEKLLTAGMHPIPQIDPALLSISGSFVSAAADYIQIAYILFTSGSTGVPKGVPVSISNLNCFLQQVTEKYDFTPADRFLQVYELTFDVAYFSFFIPMTVGACCCLLRQQAGVSKSLCIVSDLIDREISVVSMVPTVIHLAGKYIFGQQAASVRHCFFIGDALYHSEALCWQQFIPQGQIHNFYGPTEATIACADYLWQPDAPEAHVHNDVVCIGNLFSNFDYVIINEDRIEAGVDAEGELALCSGQVVKGYLGGVQPEKFLLLPVQPGRTAPFYRTGDMVRKTKDGNLLFLGRIDHQVKVNGYRIELAEVQMAIARVTKRKAIVVKKKLIHGHAGLAAYIEGGTMDVELIKAALAQILPAYMVPEQFDFMNQLPLNANGKTDYSTLQS